MGTISHLHPTSQEPLDRTPLTWPEVRKLNARRALDTALWEFIQAHVDAEHTPTARHNATIEAERLASNDVAWFVGKMFAQSTQRPARTLVGVPQ